MAKIGFARVSTNQQDLRIQLDTLKEIGCDPIFYGKQSGVSDENEKQLDELIQYIRNEDVIFVTKLDRLGRSLKSVLTTIECIHQKGATIKSLDGVIDTSNQSPFAKAMVNLIGTFAQLERDLIVSRTSEGRNAAIKAGVTFGRPPSLLKQDRDNIRKLLSSKSFSINQLAEKYKVSRTTIRRIRDE